MAHPFKRAMAGLACTAFSACVFTSVYPIQSSNSSTKDGVGELFRNLFAQAAAQPVSPAQPVMYKCGCAAKDELLAVKSDSLSCELAHRLLHAATCVTDDVAVEPDDAWHPAGRKRMDNKNPKGAGMLARAFAGKGTVGGRKFAATTWCVPVPSGAVGFGT